MSDNPTYRGIQPITRYRAFETLAAQLKEFIETEKLTSGARLPTERILANQFGVSRSTLREACRVLEAAGIIESRMGSGRYLIGIGSDTEGDAQSSRQLSGRALLTFIEFRAGLEPHLARLAAGRATNKDLEVMRGVVGKKGERELDPGKATAADATFHLAIARAARNPVALQVMQSEMLAIYWAGMWVAPLAMSGDEIHTEHDRILQAIEEGNQEDAFVAMRIHLEKAAMRVVRAGDGQASWPLSDPVSTEGIGGQ